MSYYLARRAVLKWLETPSVYQIAKDELYELDGDSFRFLKRCASDKGCSSRDSAFTDYCIEEGLLTTEKVSISRPPLTRSPNPSLRYLELQITDACNLQCKHCYIGGSGGNELAPGEVRNILAELEKMQGLRVLITGGEPLLHKQFAEINEMLPDFLLRKVLFTNGTLLTRESVKSLKVDEVQVSIDGLEHAHDRVRGSGSFARAMKGLRHALDAGFAVSVSTMVHEGNLSDFDSMERMFKDMAIREWTVDVPCLTGRLKENDGFHVSPGVGGRYLGYGYGGGLHSTAVGYGCGYHLMAVLADGKAAKCAFYRDQAACAAGQGLLTAWRQIRPVRLKDLACNCGYLEVCRGGCRYRAELISGKGGKDPYRCTMYGII